MQKFIVTGTFTVRMTGTRRVKMQRTVEAKTEDQAIDVAIEDEIAFNIGDWMESIDVESEDTENLKATPLHALPSDTLMIGLGPEIAPRLL